MMLTDPRDAFAEQSNFVSYLVGLASLARAVHALAADCNGTGSPTPTTQADDLVHLLLGVASLGDAIERLAESALAPADRAAAAPSSASANTRWLR